MPLTDDSLEWLFAGFADSITDDVDGRSTSDGPDTSDEPLARRRR